MTPIRCASELAKLLKEKFDSIDYHPTSEGMEEKTISVFRGYLPRALSDEAKRKMSPCIVIRVVSVEDALQDSRVNLELLVSTYNKEVIDGYLDLMHILELSRQWICQTPILARKFQLEKPLMVKLPEEQGFPTWWGIITVSYTVPAPGINVNQLLEDEENFL